MAWGSAPFVLGVVVGSVGRRAAAPIGCAARPRLRQGIKGGILLVREIQTLTDSVREEIEDVAAEARADVDREHGARPGREDGASRSGREPAP
jgi:hypothetical protein